jgi:hypothetical protein
MLPLVCGGPPLDRRPTPTAKPTVVDVDVRRLADDAVVAARQSKWFDPANYRAFVLGSVFRTKYERRKLP